MLKIQPVLSYFPSYLLAWSPFGPPHPVKFYQVYSPKSSHIWLLSFVSVTTEVLITTHHHSSWLGRGFLPTLHTSSLIFSFILPSKILFFKGYTIPWKIKSNFWAWVTTLSDPDPVRTRRLRQTTSLSQACSNILNQVPLPTHDISSVLLRFGR